METLKFWLDQIEKIKDLKQLRKFKNTFRKEYGNHSDAQAINEAIFNKEESFKK